MSNAPAAPVRPPERPVVLHYHLFKNAGTSLDAILKGHFGDAWVTREFEAATDGPPMQNFRAVGEWIAGSPGAAAFSSHTAMGPVPKLPGVRVHGVIFLRHPLDRIRSAWGFERRQVSESFGARLAKRTDLEGYIRTRLETPGDRFCADFHVWRLAAFHRDRTMGEFDRARAGLETLTLVGLVEQFDASVALLAAKLAADFPGFSAGSVHANRGEASDRPLAARLAAMRADLSAETWDLLLEKNAGDLALWEMAAARLRREAAEAGTPLPVPEEASRPPRRRARPALVLGIARNHDVAAAIFEGQAFAVLAEAERVTGEKHATGPAHLGPAVAAALSAIGAEPGDIEAVVLAETDKERGDALATAQMHRPGMAPLAALGPRDRLAGMPYGLTGLAGIRAGVPVFLACHHMAHAAGAVQQSGFERATVIVADGYGSCCGTAAYRYDGTFLRLEDLTDSTLLGWRHLAFGAMAREIDKDRTHVLDLSGKVMGLNAYGTPRGPWVEALAERFFDGDFAAYRRAWRVWNGAGLELPLGFGDAPGLAVNRDSHSVDDPLFRDLAASMQEAFSRRIAALAAAAVERTGIPRLVVAGGCALNVLANARLIDRFGAENVYVQPNAGDSGLPIGAAALGAAHLAGRPVHHPAPDGPGQLAARRSPFRGLAASPPPDLLPEGLVATPMPGDDPGTPRALARMLAEGAVIGLIRGRGEIGPRALGARSILAGGAGRAMRERLNAKVKQREWWRPFAPVARAPDAPRFFAGGIGPAAEVMLATLTVRPEWRAALASACHEDGTARLQAIPAREANPMLWDILGEYGAITGVPVLVNTSFNRGGRPILNSFAEAAAMLLETGLDGFWQDGRLFTRGGGA